MAEDDWEFFPVILPDIHYNLLQLESSKSNASTQSSADVTVKPSLMSYNDELGFSVTVC